MRYDKNHLASREYYLRVVFSRGWVGVRRGQFPEDTFGQRMSQRIQRRGLDAWREYGAWFWMPDGQDKDVVVRHTNGRKYITAQSKARLIEAGARRTRRDPQDGEDAAAHAVNDVEWLAD